MTNPREITAEDTAVIDQFVIHVSKHPMLDDVVLFRCTLYNGGGVYVPMLVSEIAHTRPYWMAFQLAMTLLNQHAVRYFINQPVTRVH